MSFIIGIDPGLEGALAVLNSEDGSLFAIHDMPSIGKEISDVLLAAIIKRYAGEVEAACVEKVGAMPGNGGTSMFNFGGSVRAPKAMCAYAGIPVVEVLPAKWKQAVGLPKIAKRDGESSAQAKARAKDESRALAIKTWPEDAALFTRKKDADRAEAALIARWHLLINQKRFAA